MDIDFLSQVILGTGGIELMPRLKLIIRSAFYFERVNVAEAFFIVVCL